MGETHDHDHERRTFSLSEEEFEAIAKRASQLTMQHVYEEVGKSVIKKLIWFIGLAVSGLIAWLVGTGKVSAK